MTRLTQLPRGQRYMRTQTSHSLQRVFVEMEWQMRRSDCGIAGQKRVLVVDDDPAMREMLVSYLAEQGIRASAVASRHELTRRIAAEETDLVILDLSLGPDDGLHVLHELREWSEVPVIIATGARPDEADRVIGLELGADDYVIKPFALRELLARIGVVLRRQAAARTSAQPQTERGGWRFGGWQLQRRNRRLTGPHGGPVALTQSEYALLAAFLNAPQQALSREHLLNATRAREDIFDRSIDVQVLRLRRKLEIDASSPRVIRTLRGVGYMFALPVEAI